MNSIIKNLALCALLGASVSAHAAPVLITNGDFSIPGGSGFGKFESAPNVVSFPDSGGNGGGYGLIDNTMGVWGGGLVSPADTPPPNLGTSLSSLGLVAGQTYTFSMDMKNFSGDGKGGLKVESWSNTGQIPNSSSGDMPASGQSSSWVNYTWNYRIHPDATNIKIVPLLTPPSNNAGGNIQSSIGIDNIRVNNTPVPPPPFVPLQIPNGDFEIPNGASWTTDIALPPAPVVTFPATEGNPSGNAVIDATVNEEFAAIQAFSGAEQTFASLGLSPGDIGILQVDMKILEGTNIGGLRIVGEEGYQFLSRPAIINDGSTWETYSIPFTVPNSPARALFTLVWGFNSKVAFDNVIIVVPTPAPPAQPQIAMGSMVNWTPTAPTNFYQPQESADNTVWTDLGSPITGNSITSFFDATPAPFYRVQESVPVVEDAIINGSFEETDFGFPADGWTTTQSQAPSLIMTDAKTGTNSIQIKVENALVDAAANGSEIQQNTVLAGSFITPGATYNFSMWAKQISSGPSYEQRFRVSWLAEGGGVIGNPQFTGFSGAIGVWEQKTQTGLVAPEGATSALIQILGVTGAVNGGFGEVIIDDVTLTTATPGTPATIPSTSASAAEISWQSLAGKSYQLRSSIDLSGWSPFGGVVAGNGSLKKVYDTPLVTRKFYQLGTQ